MILNKKNMTTIFTGILLAVIFIFSACTRQERGNEVEIIYYGHSCFEFQYAGRRIIIDPFYPEWFDYELPRGSLDYGFASHNAKDHSHFDGLSVEKIYLASGETDEFEYRDQNKTDKLKGRIVENIGDPHFSFWTVPSFHDDVKGARNGVNGIICFDFDGVKIVHLGDIGHKLEEEHTARIGEVDILMIPVDSYYIVPLETARAIVNQLAPVIVLPMHYKTDKSHNKAYVEDLDKFIKMFKNVKKINSSTLTIQKEDLKVGPHLLLLNYKGKEGD